METFGEVLKRKRSEKRMSQLKLANASGVNRSHIGAIESTKPGTIDLPRYQTIERLAAGLGIAPSELLEPTGVSVINATQFALRPDVDSDELLQLFNMMGDDDRERLIAIAYALYQRGQSRNG